jgi:hypothetical protein
MTIDVDVPQFGFGDYSFTEVKLKGTGNLDSLTLSGSITDATNGKGVNLPQTTFSINAANDVSDIVLNTVSNQVVNRAALAAQIRTFSDGVTVKFDTSSFVLNGKTWSIEQGGELNLRKNAVTNGQLILREGPQEIKIESVVSDIGSWSDLHVTLQNLNLGDLSPLLIKDGRLEGTLSGTVIAEILRKDWWSMQICVARVLRWTMILSVKW